ncbi:MAG: ATP-binding protein [Thermodesulfobacteriota bacterium]
MSQELIGQERQQQGLRKKQRIWWAIGLCLLAIIFLTFLETRVMDLGQVPFPVSGNVLVYVLININILLLLLMIFLVLRNLVQLVFERKRRILGTRLRTKLVLAFVSMALIPTSILFFLALQFVSTSMDYWFNINVEQALVESLTIARDVYQDGRRETVRLGRTTAQLLESSRYSSLTDTSLDLFLADVAESRGLAVLELISDQRQSLVRVVAAELSGPDVPALPVDFLRRTLAGEKDLTTIAPLAAGELVMSATLVKSGRWAKAPHVLVVGTYIPAEKLSQLTKISDGLTGYRQLMLLQQPLKTSLLVILVIVSLLVVFAAIWFGFYVAAGLTNPMGTLAEATRRVADGDLDFTISRESGDEMGTLVDSFNQMTHDLLAGRQSLQESNLELDNRRRYTETILQNVSAGVISLDSEGTISTINTFAEKLLKIDASQMLGKSFVEVLAPSHQLILKSFLGELAASGQGSLERPLQLTVGQETFSLRIHVTRLADEQGHDLGVVLVFDNLTELEKAQRMAAWREVARRIAHEVKNPLTPIQLSAQRLRKRYLDNLADEGEVFDLCTKTIINQVDELKHLVSEFSSFARMPVARKARDFLPEMVREALAIYQEGHPGLDFSFNCVQDVPPFLFDRKQLERVLVNLLDNAVAAVDAAEGRVAVDLTFDEKQKLVFLAVCDNGSGVSDEDRLHLFEPYFTTKKTGTGLGLAIVSTIISDHGGYIRVKNNKPKGTCFVVELPLVG